MLTFSRQPEGDRRLGDFLQRNLAARSWTEFRAAVAFVKRSGVRHIKELLSQFLDRGGAVKIAVGVDLRGTSIEGLTDLLETIRERGELWVFHNEIPSTFHPKVYVFKEESRAEVYVGSGNLTEGGLFTNYEAGFQASLDLTSETEQRTYQEVMAALTGWSSGDMGNGQLLTDGLLARLVALGYVVPERETVPAEDEAAATETGSRSGAGRERLFAAVGVQRAPRVYEIAVRPAAVSRVAARVTEGRIGFVMTLQQTDVGTGQVTEGTSRRSPEIFIPLVARDAAPSSGGFRRSFGRMLLDQARWTGPAFGCESVEKLSR